jgi:hypothetical protein
MIKCKNLLGKTVIRHALSEIEMELLNAIRGAK